MKNYYAILHAHRGMNIDELRKSRRLVSTTLHPDHGGSEDSMMLINEAFAVLVTRKDWYHTIIDANPQCQTCEGRGYTKIYKGFKVVGMAACGTCMGAGRTGLEN